MCTNFPTRAAYTSNVGISAYVKSASIYNTMTLRLIFEPRREEVTGEWRRFYKELNDLYPSPNIVRVIKLRRTSWAGHVARMSEKRGVYRVLVGKPEGKTPLGRSRCR